MHRPLEAAWHGALQGQPGNAIMPSMPDGEHDRLGFEILLIGMFVAFPAATEELW